MSLNEIQKRKNVYLVVLPVARALPELGIVHVGSDDLLEATLPVVAAHELNKGVVDACAVGQEEAAARAELVEKEELVLLFRGG